MGEKITQTEFARRMGVAQKNVNKSIKNGRIQKEPDGKIDFESASKDWFENKDPSRVSSNTGGNGGIHNDEATQGYARARVLQTAWNVKIKQLQYEKAAGKLIEKEAVMASLRKFSIYVRDSILAIPDRVSARMSSQVEEYVAKVLRKNLPKALADKVIQELSSDHMHKITRETWEAESRAVMEELENGKIIKED